jgi:hypothetical protein
MVPMTSETFAISSRGIGLAFVVVLLCFCVVAQMLGTPVTLINLLDAKMSMELASEDLSIPSGMPITGLTSSPVLYEQTALPLYLPIFATSIFHPPQA